MSKGLAPLWLIIVTQLVSVLGDACGQRCARVYHHRSRRRFLLSMVVVTAVQMTIAIGVVQWVWPQITTDVTKRINGSDVAVCDLPTNDTHYPEGGCYAQGPWSLPKTMQLCPWLWLNGGICIVYYFAEASLYREPVGLLLLVMAALSSTFLVAPFESLAGLAASAPAPPLSIALGVVGAIVCTLERTPKAAGANASADARRRGDGASTPESMDSLRGSSAPGRSPGGDGPSSSAVHVRHNPNMDDGDDDENDPILIADAASGARAPIGDADATPASGCGSWARGALVLCMVALLAVVYAWYFVLMRFYDERCSVNLWGYNAVDQGLLPLYLWPAIALAGSVWNAVCGREATAMERVSHLPFSRFEHVGTNTAADDEDDVASRLDEHFSHDAHDSKDLEPFHRAVARAAKEDVRGCGGGLLWMFLYRLLINARALSYTYIVADYDLGQSYLELTLVRVLVSWLGALVVVLALPRFIGAQPFEQAKLKDPLNLALKIAGSAAITVSLVVLNKK